MSLGELMAVCSTDIIGKAELMDAPRLTSNSSHARVNFCYFEPRLGQTTPKPVFGKIASLLDAAVRETMSWLGNSIRVYMAIQSTIDF